MSTARSEGCSTMKWTYPPYRKVIASGVNNWRIQIDTLECGHQVFRRVVFHPEKASRRRCRKCLKLHTAMRRVRK